MSTTKRQKFGTLRKDKVIYICNWLYKDAKIYTDVKPVFIYKELD
jgi:hypothetical protein